MRFHKDVPCSEIKEEKSNNYFSDEGALLRECDTQNSSADGMQYITRTYKEEFL